jgi:hypothetical protein
VREDERAKHQGQSVMLTADANAAIAAAEAEMLDKCIAAVERTFSLYDQDNDYVLGEVLAALRALQEKP